MSYFAEIDADSVVIRVVVADDIQWCIDNLDGEWLETADPYTEPGTLVYCGPGYGADRAVPERFALPWDAVAAVTPNELGQYRYRTNGEVVFHAGKIWRNLMPTDNPNVWEPGVANWREYPMGVNHPLWVQPVGAVDAYPLEFVVEHAGKVWRNVTPANVWEPGVVVGLWEEVVPDEVI